MNVKAWRKSLNLTQAAAAAHLGLAQGMLSNYENGKRLPRPATMRRIREMTGGAVVEADWYAPSDETPDPVTRADNSAAHHLAAATCEAAHG